MPELSEMFANPGPRWMQGPPNETAKWLEKGYEMGEERRQFDIYQQRLQDLDALNKRAKDQDYELQAIVLKNKIYERDQMIASEGAFVNLSKIFAEQKLAGIAGTDAAQGRIRSAMANNPSAYRHPGMKDLLADIELSAKDYTQAEEHRLRDVAYMERVVAQQTGQNQRKRWDVESREYVADTRSDAQIESAHIKAEADVHKATISAEKWKDHSRFAAFKDASAAIKLQIDPVKEPEKYAEAVRGIYNKLLPSGEPNAWDAGPAAPLSPIPAPSKFEWTPDGIKKKN